MSLTVLSVSYPLARVSPDSTGGSEQVLAALDRALVAAGHRSVVVAPEGSRVAGDLAPIRWTAGTLDDAAKAGAQAANRAAIAGVLARTRVDLVHLHGIDFAAYLPPPGQPVLATLHLPPAWYGADALSPARPGTFLNCVSAAQHAACPPSPALVAPIENGVPVGRLAAARHARRGFALVLGRICPEKGIHLALEAAHRADVPLLVAGEVYGYAAHRAYFEDEVRPRLDARRRFLGPFPLVHDAEPSIGIPFPVSGFRSPHLSEDVIDRLPDQHRGDAPSRADLDQGRDQSRHARQQFGMIVPETAVRDCRSFVSRQWAREIERAQIQRLISGAGRVCGHRNLLRQPNSVAPTLASMCATDVAIRAARSLPDKFR